MRRLWIVSLALGLLLLALAPRGTIATLALAGPAPGGGWSVPGSASAGVLPLQVVATDPGAGVRQLEAETALQTTMDAVASLFAWRPRYPLALYLVAGDQGMVDALQRYADLSAPTAESYRPFYGAFVSHWSHGQPHSALFMNLARLGQKGQLQHAIAHEYLHVLQWDWAGLTSPDQPPVPYWFLEGMADVYASRIAGTSVAANQQQASRDAAEGRSTPLEQLRTLEDWKRHTRSLRGQMDAYGKAFTAVELLEKAEPQISGDLLKSARSEAGGFEAALGKLVGVNLPQLDLLLQDRLLGRSGALPTNLSTRESEPLL